MELNKEKNFVSAVIYCYNDADTIGDFIKNLDNTLSNCFLKYEIIVVNDASKDNSVSVIKQYAAHKEGKVVTVLNMSHYQGLESAMNAGVDLAIGDFVYEFDSASADFDWGMMMRVYYHSLKGFDIVGARTDAKVSLKTKLFYALFNKYANLQYEINTEAFRILSRRAINRIHSITQSVPFRKAAYANCGLAIDCITYKPSNPDNRRKHVRDVTVNSLILFTDVAYRVTVGLSILMALFTLFFGGYALFYKLLENPVEGWTTTVILICFGFFGLFVILSTIIKYLQTIVNLVFKKKDYLFESIEKLQ